MIHRVRPKKFRRVCHHTRLNVVIFPRANIRTNHLRPALVGRLHRMHLDRHFGHDDKVRSARGAQGKPSERGRAQRSQKRTRTTLVQRDRDVAKDSTTTRACKTGMRIPSRDDALYSHQLRIAIKTGLRCYDARIK